MRHLRCISLAAGIALLAPGLAAGSTVETRFVVLGDIPYDGNQARVLDQEIGGKIRSEGYPFVVHYGDIKSGGEKCRKELLKQRRDLIYGLHSGAVFYTPGDNEWTDCDRNGDDELESLNTVRALFFEDGATLPTKPAWEIVRQHAFPENARWRLHGLLIATFHIVGSDNGRHEIGGDATTRARMLKLVDARDEANGRWLDMTFDQAGQQESPGLVLVMHGDPNDLEYRDHKDVACGPARPTECNPYLRFIDQLKKRGKSFDKPILLIHGSTEAFCLDRAFGGTEAKKLWRLNGPGDGVVDAASVTFDPLDTVRPFKIASLLDPRSKLPGPC